MSKILIVDDVDPAISYTGDWHPSGTVRSTSREYHDTISVGVANGQSLSYEFYGTSIAVYGSVDSPATRGLPGVEFKIDSFPPERLSDTYSPLFPTYNSTGFNTYQPLYRSQPLAADTHTISITVTNVTVGGPFFWFDFFMVGSGRESVAGHVLLDDRDEAIRYHRVWADAGVSPELMQTTRWPVDTGAYATLEFNGLCFIRCFMISFANISRHLLVDVSLL